MKKIKIVSLMLALVMFAGISGCKKDNKNTNKEDNKKIETKNTTEKTEKTKAPVEQSDVIIPPVTEQETASEEEKVYTPTFMYFVDETDANYAETNEVIERLKKEYEDRVIFDVRNVTQDPSQLQNFPIEGQTPALIMLDKNNNIMPPFVISSSNYDELKASIEKALQ